MMTRTLLAPPLGALLLGGALLWSLPASTASICYPGAIMKDGSSNIGCFFEDKPTEAGSSGTCGGATPFNASNDGTCSLCLVDPYDDLITSDDICDLGDIRCLACVDPPSGMVGWWSFDSEYMTDAFDDDWSDYDNYAGVWNGSTWAATTGCGQVTQGVTLDGTNDYVQVWDDPSVDVGTGDFSFSLWIKYETSTPTSGTRYLIEKFSSTANVGYRVVMLSRHPVVYYRDAVGHVTGNTSAGTTIPADGAWHHLAITVDRDSTTGLKFYIDGALVKSANASVASGSLDSSAVLRFGTRSTTTTSGYNFGGGLDEVQLYKRALTSTEILDIVDAGVYGNCYGG